jgi:U32 family peptidase
MEKVTEDITAEKKILQQNKKMEIVSPAGGWDCLAAAINGGADAVYLGYKRYSARAFAENFDLPHLKKAVAFAHASGVKAYLAVNTLLKDSELPELTGFLNEYLAFCRDGLIIQDLGLFKVLSDLFPSERIHASTQLNIHNSKSIQLLSDLNFARTVLAREMTLGEISAITSGESMEIEVFAHGSQCYSYSGSCYFSSFTGLRSGNRGRCTQPCRMKYSIKTAGSIKSAGSLLLRDSYILSKSDLFALNILPELAKAGISALKIEGRMKTPEYVGIITKLYRKYLDLYYSGAGNYSISKEDIYKAAQIFSREMGPGYLKEEFPKEIVSLKKSGSIGNLLGRITWIGHEKPGPANLNSSKNIKPFRPGSHSRKAAFSETAEAFQVKSSWPIAKGDLLEIWTNKGNEQIKVNEFKLLEMAGDKYIFSIDPGKKIRLNIGDRVFKSFDFNLDKEAKSLYVTGLKNVDLKTVSLASTKAGKKSLEINEYFGGKYNGFINGGTAKNAHSKQIYPPGTGSTWSNKSSGGKTGLIVEIYDIADAEKIVNSGIQGIILNNYRQTIEEVMSNFDLIKSLSINCKNKDIRLSVKLPQIIYDKEFVHLETGLKILYESGIRNFSVPNLGILKSLAEIADGSIGDSSNNGNGRNSYISNSNINDSIVKNNGSGSISCNNGNGRNSLINNNNGNGNIGARGNNSSSINNGNTLEISLEFCMNVFNHKTVAFYCGLGKKYPSINIKAIGLSPELSINEIKTLIGLASYSGISGVEFSLYGYGYYPAMRSRYKLEYLVKDININKLPEKYYLVDQKGYDFRVVKDYNDDLVFLNSKKICTLFDLPEALSSGIDNLHIDARTFEIVQTQEIIWNYRKALGLCAMGHFKELDDFLKNAGENSLFSDYTKGHLDREVI